MQGVRLLAARSCSYTMIGWPSHRAFCIPSPARIPTSSTTAPNLGKTRFINIASYRVKLGHTEDLMAGSKMILGALEKANLQFPVLAYEVMAGVPEGLFLFIEPMESLKTLDEGPARDRAMIEAMGAENFGRLMKGTGDVFATIETNLFSVSPQMSYVSKEVEDTDANFWKPKAPAKPVVETTPKEKTGQ